MKSAQALEQTLTSLDGQKYGAYKQIKTYTNLIYLNYVLTISKLIHLRHHLR